MCINYIYWPCLLILPSGVHNEEGGGGEGRRSVNRPRINEIFGMCSHASGYPIFSTHHLLVLVSTHVNYGERLLLHEHTQGQVSKRSICTTFCNPPTIPSIGCSAFSVRLPAPETWTLDASPRSCQEFFVIWKGHASR